MPLVSVVMPCFNAAPYVAEAIRTVVDQTLRDWELVVVDDGCTDESLELVADWAARDPRVGVVRKANGGVASARNAGYRAADESSSYLLFLDADDCLEPEMLTIMTEYLDAHADVGMAYCRHVLIDAAGATIADAPAWTPRYAPAPWGVRRLRAHEPHTPFVSVLCLAGVVPSLAVIRRSAYVRTNGWDEPFGQICEDTNLFLEIGLEDTIHYLDKTLVRHRRHASQSTAEQDRFRLQERKLEARWRDTSGLTESQRKAVRSAWRFRDRRLVPLQAVWAAGRYARRGRLVAAGRFLGGAGRIAGRSFLGRSERT
jgi:glycosyltransferase involved in cell wall biosynthesis